MTESSTEIEIADALVPVTIYGTSIEHPRQAIALATAHAKVLTEVLKEQGLTNKIGNREYVRVEGWTLLGSLLGVAAVETFTRPVPEEWREMGLERPEGWESRYEARRGSGEIVGAANGRCMRDEGQPGRNGKKKWQDADDYAIASMAQTRATSKSLRTALGFIVSLAGFNATPAEEMDGVFAPAATTAAETSPEDPASDETFERARLLLGDDATAGDVAKAYLTEHGLEGPIFRTPHGDRQVVEEGKLAALCASLEAIAEEKEVVEGELVTT